MNLKKWPIQSIGSPEAMYPIKEDRGRKTENTGGKGVTGLTWKREKPGYKCRLKFWWVTQ